MTYLTVCKRWLLLLCLLAAPSWVVGNQQPASADQPLTILLADVWPWAYETEHGMTQGLLVDLVRQLENSSGQALRIRLLPHQRLVFDFARHQGDLCILFANPEVDNFAERVAPVLSTSFVLVAPRSRQTPLNLKALAGESVGYIRGTFYGDEFAADQSIRKVPVHNLEQAVMMLKRGRLQALISSAPVFYHTLQQLDSPVRDWQIMPHADAQQAYLYRQRDGVPLQSSQALQSALAELERQGKLAGLTAPPQRRQSPPAQSQGANNPDQSSQPLF